MAWTVALLTKARLLSMNTTCLSTHSVVQLSTEQT